MKPTRTIPCWAAGKPSSEYRRTRKNYVPPDQEEQHEAKIMEHQERVQKELERLRNQIGG